MVVTNEETGLTYLEETGLAPGYINCWIVACSILEAANEKQEGDVRRLFSGGVNIKSYVEYFTEHHPEQLAKAMEVAEPVALTSLNQLVTEYNALPRNRRTLEVCREYRFKCEKVVDPNSIVF